MNHVYIVAGGPGDPELITVKGRKIIENADIIFVSMRFFQAGMFAGIKKDCEVIESSNSSCEEKLKIVKDGVRQGKTIVFVNMGDPFLYGMIRGLADRLEKTGIDYEIVPGVSSLNASCAILKKQMTGFEIANTLICSTYRDRTDPETYLDQVASLGASVALFMSVEFIDRICDVFKVHYPADTPVAIISNASRENQKVVCGDLRSIHDRIKEENITDGLILIGEFIDKFYDYDLEKKFREMHQAKNGVYRKIK
jgi:precorrin-4/cobalt-precorrin-4 C11-methyltransferase